jgi:hypothetical protein
MGKVRSIWIKSSTVYNKLDSAGSSNGLRSLLGTLRPVRAVFVHRMNSTEGWVLSSIPFVLGLATAEGTGVEGFDTTAGAAFVGTATRAGLAVVLGGAALTLAPTVVHPAAATPDGVYHNPSATKHIS